MNSDPTAPTYMFLFRYPDNDPEPSPEQMQQSFEKWRKWIQAMKARGEYLGGQPLEETPGKVLRGVRGSRASDGPFVEAKEIVAGFMLIRARDFAHAVEIARDCPGLEAGEQVEVRQIKPLQL